jgi:cysteine synthase
MVIVSIGTAGTGVGTSMRLKEYNPQIQIIGVTPKIGVSIQGLRNPEEPYPTQLFREKWFDEIIEIPAEDVPKIFEITRTIVKKEGLFVGMSAGAVLYIALQKAKELGQDKTIVAILPDGGEKYLTTNLFES